MSNKMSIEWHEDCLKNRKSYLERLRREIQVAQANYLEKLEEVKKYERQIERAKKIGERWI